MGNLIIVTVPVDSPPDLSNYQYQLSLVNSLEDKKRLPFAYEDEVVVMVYNEGWSSITWFSITEDGEVTYGDLPEDD